MIDRQVLPPSLREFAPKIAAYADGRKLDPPTGIHVSYLSGWKSAKNGKHEDIVDDVKAAVYNARKAAPCDCQQCTPGATAAAEPPKLPDTAKGRKLKAAAEKAAREAANQERAAAAAAEKPKRGRTRKAAEDKPKRGRPRKAKA